MKYFDKKAERIWLDYIITNLDIIEVVPGKCRYNYECHRNTIHEACVKDEEKIAVVFTVNRNEQSLHYVNYDGKKYIDNTLGVWSGEFEYYLVRYITKSQFFSNGLLIFDKILDQYRKMIPFWWRWLVKTRI